MDAPRAVSPIPECAVPKSSHADLTTSWGIDSNGGIKHVYA